MKKFLTFFFALGYLAFAGEKPFVIVIPSYNNAFYFQRNLDSVLKQNYSNFRAIYIDDASTDHTGFLVDAYLKENDLQHRITLIQNSQRVGSLANKYKGIWLCDPAEIVVDLDGDDWLSHEHVLSYLNQIYSDPNIWVTYGQFIYHPCGSPGWAAQVPTEIIEQNAFREYSWVTTALRTFYAGLFQKIKKEDLYFNGDFFFMAGDLAFMFPIVEMAGMHSRFIPDVLYVYNIAMMINDGTKDRDCQLRLGWAVREKPKYLPVKSPY